MRIRYRETFTSYRRQMKTTNNKPDAVSEYIFVCLSRDVWSSSTGATQTITKRNVLEKIEIET